MFESGSNPIGLHMDKVEFHIPFKIQHINNVQDFGIGRIATFSLDSIMYKGMILTFNQEHQAFMYPNVGGIHF